MTFSLSGTPAFSRSNAPAKRQHRQPVPHVDAL